jgi:hypothetical protein
MLNFYEWVRRTSYDYRAPGEPFQTDEYGRPDAVRRVQEEAQAYNRRYDLPPIDHDTYYSINIERAGRIADAYDALPVDDADNPLVANAYRALAREVVQQYRHAIMNGMTFEPWTGEGDAYVDAGKDYDVQECFRVIADIRDNQHLFFFTGGSPNRFMSQMEPSTGLPVNDLFRAIHDYYGHAAMGADFGPRGEENAWVCHMQMFTPAAQHALTTETRGQNSWVNFGRQNYDEQGNYKNIAPQDRPFAQQKCAVFSGPMEWVNYEKG